MIAPLLLVTSFASLTWGQLCAPFTLGESARLIALLRQRFASGCVFLLYDHGEDVDDLQMFTELTKLEKMLGDENIPTVSVPFTETELRSGCQGSNPLFVIVTNHISAQDSLRKLTSKTSLSGSVWLQFLPDISLPDFFEGIHIPFNCEFMVAHQDNESKINLTEVYHVTRGAYLQVNHLENWSAANWSGASLYERRNDLQGFVFNVTTLNYDPMLIVNETSPSNIGGFFGEIWHNLEVRMNFTSRFVIPQDKSWGSLKNGTWNGMVRLLLDGDADVAVNAFTMTKSRMKAVDFSITIMDTSTCVFIGLRNDRSLNWDDYLKPFSNGLWMAIATCIVFIAFYMSLLYHLGRKAGTEENEPQCQNPLVSIFYVFGIFCQQGHDITPTMLSCRIVYFTTYVTAVILLASYSASLIAFLTVIDLKMPFNTFIEMLRHTGGYRLGMAAGSGVLNIFDQANDTLLKSIYKNLIAPGVNNLPSNTQDAARRLCNSNYAYMRSIINQLYSEDCNIVPVPKASFQETLSIMMPKKSPYKGLINHHLQSMKELGVLRRIALRIWPKMINLESNPFSTVGLENVIPILAVLTLGVVSSIVLLFMERIGCRVVRQIMWSGLQQAPDQHLAETDVDHDLSTADRIGSSIISTSQELRMRRMSVIGETASNRLMESDHVTVDSDSGTNVLGMQQYLTDEDVQLRKMSAVVQVTTTPH